MNKFTGYFTIALLALASSVAMAEGDAEAGAAKAEGCAGCHGAAGEGSGDNPPLAGLDQAEHIEMLQEYKAGTRGEAMMQMFAANLGDQDMADLAAYYAGLAECDKE